MIFFFRLRVFQSLIKGANDFKVATYPLQHQIFKFADGQAAFLKSLAQNLEQLSGFPEGQFSVALFNIKGSLDHTR